MAVRKNEMGRELLERVRSAVLGHQMVVRGDGVVVGVSGGLDSVSLLHILSGLQAEFCLKLVVAHVHHGLRDEEGEKEFRFVEGLASGYGLPFEGRRVRSSNYAKGTNLQAGARSLRIRFFEEVAEKWGAARIATGHHRDDHAETLLMQVLRGTGGLIGIRPVRDGRYIRPLIEIPRDEIRAYAEGAGLLFCEDSSNRKRTYLRNRIRQDLVPWIRREANPSFEDSLLRLASIRQEEAQCLDALAEEAFQAALSRTGPGGEVVLRRDTLASMPRPIQRRVLRLSYRRLEGSTQGLSYAHTKGICGALAEPEGGAHKLFCLPRGIRVFMEYEDVCFTRRDLWEEMPYAVPVQFGQDGWVRIPEAGITLCAHRATAVAPGPAMEEDRNQAFLDADRAAGQMIVRSPRPGDRFRPVGLGGEKKLKNFFIDERIPRSLRRRIAILEVGGRVAWVVGCRIDDRFKVSERTRTILRIQAVPDDSAEGTWGGKLSQIKR